jgi:DNA-binding response OmpR family regulator
LTCGNGRSGGVNVLLVEDESRVADFIDRGLRAENHGVTVAPTGGEGVELAKTGEFDVIILDLMLPDMHGYDVCQRLRQEGQHTPILMLTAMDALEDKIKGIKIGADDYLTKPFDFDELLVRIEALVRRSHNFAQSSNLLKVADLELDKELLEVKRGGEAIKLTAKELAILELLMSAPGRVFSRTRILNQVWGYSEDPLTNVVDVYIARLRRKIDTKGRDPLIETVRGHGYRLKAAG